MLRKFGVNEELLYYTDAYYYENNLNLLSCYAYERNMTRFSKLLSKGNVTLSFNYTTVKVDNENNYFISKTYHAATDLCHMVLLRKEHVTETGFEFYLLTEEQPTDDQFFEKIATFSRIALLKEWQPFIISSLKKDGFIVQKNVAFPDLDSKPKIQLYCCNIYFSYFETLVSNALKAKKICISNKTNRSSLTNEFTLTHYLTHYSDILASKIQNHFTPKFNPYTESYSNALLDYEDWCYNDGKGILLYTAQKDMISASAKTLSKEHRTIVVGECGCGKTKMAAGITYVHGKQLGYNAVVMCPGHLVHKWAREISESVPNAKYVIIHTITNIENLRDELKNRVKAYNLYLIMSYESSKLGYKEMPCALYKEIYPIKNELGQVSKLEHKVYVCPKCGNVLKKEVKKEVVNLGDEDFTKPNKHNRYCNGKILVYDYTTGKNVEQDCHEKLWRPIASQEEYSMWVHLGESGWYRADRIRPLYNEFLSKKRLTAKEKVLAAIFSKQMDIIQAKMTELQVTYEKLDISKVFSVHAKSKYPIAQYIKEQYNKDIDYTIFDEMHKLKGDEDVKQAVAMGHLVDASRNVIGLTGTLINGYATSLFYLLYRMFPRKMRKSGYKYNDCLKFLRTYGSVKTTFENSNGTRKNTNMRPMAGISPLLFVEYLLDVCGFISLDDVADGLPSYMEIPLAVDMDATVSAEYNRIKEAFKRSVGYNGQHPKTMSSFLYLLRIYPDMSYGQMPIVDYSTSETVYTPLDITDVVDNKFERTLALVKQKVEAGEKVLIYQTTTNSTDVKERFKYRIDALGFKSVILDTDHAITIDNKKKKVSLIDRETYIDSIIKENVDVLICNPVLVETGLDLIDFTTVIFHQFDYNIFTMRQASRRSWRLGQTHPVEVYFMYYNETIQEDALALMATKMQASMTAEGKSSDEGLSTLSVNDDITTQITNNVIKGISSKVNMSSFDKNKRVVNGKHIVLTDTRLHKTRHHLTYRKPKVVNWMRFRNHQPQQSVSDPAIFSLAKKNIANIKIF